MADTNKNMDNEQTVYYDNQNQAGGGVPHNPYIQQGVQQNPHNPYVQQGEQQNPYNPYVQQGEQQTPYFQAEIPPQIPPGYSGRKKKSNAALITLIIIIILLFFAIIGVTLFIFLHDSDDDERSSAHEFSSEYDGDEEDDDYDGKPHGENARESKKESKVESETEKNTAELTEAVLISVPDLTGMDINEAIKYCADNFVIESDRQYSDTPYNKIIKQTPEPKSELKKGAIISVIVSSGPDPEQEIIIPNVCGKTFEEARDELEKLGILVNSAYEENKNAAAGQVIEQNTAAGTKIKKGTSVILTVSTGSGVKNLDNFYGAIKNTNASSQLKEEKVGNEMHYYDASKVVDGDYSTCWCEGRGDGGIGESLTIEFNDVYSIEEITLWNGLCTNDELYRKNCRIHNIRIIFSDGTSHDYELKNGWENRQNVINLSERKETSSVTFVILDVYEGETYSDTCISEISIK